jgi:anti-sigma regulatory factor (Ser/Thr protein kinase)
MFTDPNDSIADSVTLTASELVTNVVLHTDSGGLMQAWDPKPDIPLRLEVEDHDPTIPTTRDNPITGGRGLTIVDNVADAWGVEPTPDGKVVWAEFNRPADG